MNKIPFIKRGYAGGMEFHNANSASSFWLLILFFITISAFFLALVLRLFQLTIVKGDYYRRLSEDNRIKEVVIEPERGKIIDRKGIVLVYNTPADLQQEGNRLFSKRIYDDPEIFAHVIGYRQAADEVDMKNDDCLVKIKKNDAYVDKVGKRAVEKLFDCDLRGKYGKKLMEVDAMGKSIRPLHVELPENGKDVQLSIDAELQKTAYAGIQGQRAAVVAMKPSTGEVLVLASSPTYNPQAFEDGDNVAINSYFADKEKNPMFNRSTEGTYPPGSTFKIVMSTGALEEESITKDTIIEDTGYIMAGTLKFATWAYNKSGKKDGNVNVIKALQKSNDIYFYKVGEKLGPEKIKEWAEKMGYNQVSNLGIEENQGTIPSPFWKEEILKEKWYLGDTYNTSIGQGYILATPLQVARSTQVIANNGVLCQPTLLKLDSEINARLESSYDQKNCKKLPISQETLDIVHEGMREACTTGGTAYPMFDFAVTDPTAPKPPKEATGSAALVQKRKIETACKTGTAESHETSGIPHAWFTIYAPAKNPEIVVTVLIEGAGEGSDLAAPIAKEVLKTYFERRE